MDSGDKERPSFLAAGGFTLIELIAVILIVTFIGVAMANRLDSLFAWQQRAKLREFVSTWQFVAQEALGRGEIYRLIIDLDSQTYFVRREIPITDTDIRNVDFLKNLRTKGEKERRAKEQDETLLSLEQEFQEEDYRQSDSLERLYFNTIFADPVGNVRTGIPLDFPNLAEPRPLGGDLRFRDIRVGGEQITNGRIYIRLTPSGVSDFAIVHLVAKELVFTVISNPTTGEVRLTEGDKEFEWIVRSVAEQAQL